MASIENRSRYQVSAKNCDDLTKTFAHSSETKAEEYCESLAAQNHKPKLSRLDDNYIIPIRRGGLDEQVLYASSLKPAELVKAKLKVEHSQGSTIRRPRTRSSLTC